MPDIVQASHRLKERFGSEFPGIRPGEAADAEKQLGLPLPRAYIEFLQICNRINIEQESIPAFGFFPLESADVHQDVSVIRLHLVMLARRATYNTEKDAVLEIGIDHSTDNGFGFATSDLHERCVDAPVYREVGDYRVLTPWAPSLTCLVDALANWDLRSEIEFVGDQVVYKELQPRGSLLRRLLFGE